MQSAQVPNNAREINSAFQYGPRHIRMQDVVVSDVDVGAEGFQDVGAEDYEDVDAEGYEDLCAEGYQDVDAEGYQYFSPFSHVPTDHSLATAYKTFLCGCSVD